MQNKVFFSPENTSTNQTQHPELVCTKYLQKLFYETCLPLKFIWACDLTSGLVERSILRCFMHMWAISRTMGFGNILFYGDQSTSLGQGEPLKHIKHKRDAF